MNTVPVKKNEQRKQLYKSLEAKSLRSRSILTNISDGLTSITGTPLFLILNISFFAVWLVMNTNLIPDLVPFDPFPFGLLTTIVSLEAIFLSIFVLISQNRSAYIGTIREEVNLRLNLVEEEEITKILEMLGQIKRKLGITTYDPELKEMLDQTDVQSLERGIAEQVQRANKPVLEQIKKEVPELLLNTIKKPIEVVSTEQNTKNSMSS
jgi:uncharacterized membrane protein